MPGQKIAQVRRLMFHDERVGMAFNSESGLALNSPFALDEMIVDEDPNAPGMEVFSTITQINSHEQLMESIGLSVEAQGRYAFFSADMKAQFSESTSYESTSTFLIAKVIVENPFTRGRNFKLTADNEKLLRTQEAIFKQAFGDSYVRGMQTGGEFYSVIRITSVSTVTQSDLAVTLQAAYQGLVTAAEFQGKFNEANKSDKTRTEFSALMFQRAGTGSQISPTRDIAEVLARVKEFPTIVQASPVAYEIEVATYDTVPLPFPTPEEAENFSFALRDASAQKLHYIQARNDLELARRHPELFVDLPPHEVLLGAINAYTQLINEVMRHGIELSTGRMQPPRAFDPSKLAVPLSEPAPIPLKRAPGGPAGVVRLPDLVGADVFQMAQLQVCLAQGGALRACVDGTAFLGPDGELRPISIDSDVAEFLNMAENGGLDVRWLPMSAADLVQGLPGSATLSVTAQDPLPGTEVPTGATVIVQLSAVPD
jgi:hypothetical protein